MKKSLIFLSLILILLSAFSTAAYSSDSGQVTLASWGGGDADNNDDGSSGSDSSGGSEDTDTSQDTDTSSDDSSTDSGGSDETSTDSSEETGDSSSTDQQETDSDTSQESEDQESTDSSSDSDDDSYTGGNAENEDDSYSGGDSDNNDDSSDETYSGDNATNNDDSYAGSNATNDDDSYSGGDADNNDDLYDGGNATNNNDEEVNQTETTSDQEDSSASGDEESGQDESPEEDEDSEQDDPDSGNNETEPEIPDESEEEEQDSGGSGGGGTGSINYPEVQILQPSFLNASINSSEIKLGETVKVTGNTSLRRPEQITVSLDGVNISSVYPDSRGRFQTVFTPETTGDKLIKVSGGGFIRNFNLKVTSTVRIQRISTPLDLKPETSRDVCVDFESSAQAEVTLYNNGNLVGEKVGLEQVCLETEFVSGENTLRAVAQVEGDRDEKTTVRDLSERFYTQGISAPSTGSFISSTSAQLLASVLVGLAIIGGIFWREGVFSNL